MKVLRSTQSLPLVRRSDNHLRSSTVVTPWERGCKLHAHALLIDDDDAVVSMSTSPTVGIPVWNFHSYSATADALCER